MTALAGWEKFYVIFGWSPALEFEARWYKIKRE
jgi:hypothetical protein